MLHKNQKNGNARTLFHFGVVKSVEPDKCFERRLLAFPRECPKGVAKSFALRLSLLSLPWNRREREIESRLSHFRREEEGLGTRLANYTTGSISPAPLRPVLLTLSLFTQRKGAASSPC